VSSSLVIGYGNTLRSDDGAGVRAAELIRAAVPEVEVVVVPQLTPELAESISRHRHVVFLDASAQTDWQGLRVLPVDATGHSSAPVTHAASPEQLLQLSASVYGAVPERTVLVTIPAVSFELGETLSPLTARRVVECVDWLRSELSGLPQRPPRA
jgi:hydrogenase maturation protease